MTPPLRTLTLLAFLSLPVLACGDPEPGSTDRVAAPPVDTLLHVEGTEIFVHTEGSGEPLVVVHGGPLLDHGHLVPPLRPLGDRFRLVFYDQRLAGRSAGTVDSASVSLDQFVADIEAIRTALGLDRIHLLGHSWGGLIAMEYAIAHPDRLRSLVLVSPLPPSSTLWQGEQRAQNAALQPADTAGMGELRSSSGMEAGDPVVIERLLQMSFRSQLHDPALADSLRFDIPIDYMERSRLFGLMMADLQSFDLLDALAGLDVPTLVVYGDAETGAQGTADTLIATIPDARARGVADAGHFSFFERPETFRRLLADFLEELR